MVAAQLDRLEHHPSKRPERRIEPQRLRDYLVGEGQIGQVVEGGVTVAQHVVQLRVEPFLHFGVLGEKVERVRQGRRRGVVPGDVQGDRLVAHQFVTHPAVLLALGILVPHLQQHAQQVVAFGARLPALLDQAVYQLVQVGPRGLEAPGGRYRKAMEKPPQKRRLGQTEVHVSVGLRKRLAHAPDNVARLDIEQGLGNYLERQFTHLLLHVHPGPVLPLPGFSGRDFGHGLGVMFDVSAMKPRLYQPPLLQMKCSGGRHEAVSHHPAYGLKRSSAPPGFLVVGHQDLPVELGVIHQVDQDGLHRHSADVAVGGGLLQQADQAEPKAKRLPDKRQLGWPRRQFRSLDGRPGRIQERISAGRYRLPRASLQNVILSSKMSPVGLRLLQLGSSRVLMDSL